ncbi:MAG: M23 family metallopeptidase [Flavobacteriaceae bacterium]|nr:M23 family metallopeptidase [Flavobacteriaceae bacterium]
MKLKIAFFLLLGYLLNGQSPYPQDAFDSPLDIPLILAGTFGELRSNHFHSGLDIKTQSREGLSVKAIGPGTVSRIKISHWGYGKVLYLAHPNGYTSVYAHLQKFAPKIEEYIKKKQYEKQTFEIELFPDYGELTVDQGELIAYGGNTGGSSGPHLHFEIRNSVSEMPINPLLFGYSIRDATDPTLVDAYAYPLSEDAQLNKANTKLQLNIRRQTDGTYVADTLNAAGTIGFGLNTYDRQDMAANKNGPYSVTQLVNGEVYSDLDFDSFSFSETRYLNTLIDYEHFGKTYQRVQRCFKVPGNNLSIYNTLKNDGKIEVVEGENYEVTLQIRDLAGNTTVLKVPVQGKRLPLEIKESPIKTDYFLAAQKPNNYDLGIARVYFPANTFYNDFYLDLSSDEKTVSIHQNTVPAHRNFTISFDVSHIPMEERKQWFIARLDSKLRPDYSNTYKRNNTFTTRTRQLGTYTLAKDITPPKVRTKNFKPKQWLTNYRYLSLLISDDMSGIDSYTATINGEWILMEYEPKTNTITYNFDDKILDKTECELEVTVKDNVGNTTVFKSTFFRK